MSFRAVAPGSLMLLGEYGVLYGKQALVCAVDKHVTVTLTPRADDRIEIHSVLGTYSTTIQHITLEAPFHFVLGPLKQHQTRLKHGCDIRVESEFSHQVGLGSSAAVTVATLAVVLSWLGVKTSPIDLIRQGRQVVRHIQGVGSGADVAASVYGGMVAYQTQPLFAEKFSSEYPITVHYSGYKTPTKNVIQTVQASFASQPNLLRSLANSIGQCAAEGVQWLRKENWAQLGKVMTIQQGLMESLGVSTALLRKMVDELSTQTGILGAKISGSGLGDCIVGLGESTAPSSYEKIPVNMTLQGVYCEKI